MDLDKAWLYRQGTWTVVDDPAAQVPEEIDNWFERLRYNQAPRTYGVPGEHSVTIYYGPLFPKENGAPSTSTSTIPTMSRWKSRE